MKLYLYIISNTCTIKITVAEQRQFISDYVLLSNLYTISTLIFACYVGEIHDDVIVLQNTFMLYIIIEVLI